MSRRATLFKYGLTATALLAAPRVAFADAPRDIQTNQRLWLDGLDVNGTDIGNGGGTNPANGAQVTQWKDKSPNGYTAGDATYMGALTRSYPTYSNGAGVYFNGTSSVLQIAGGLYPVGSSNGANEVYMVHSVKTLTYAINFCNCLRGGGATRFSASLPSAWGPYMLWDHALQAGDVGRLSTTWGRSLNQSYIYNLTASTAASSQVIRVDGTSAASKTNPASYNPGTTADFFVGGVPGAGDFLDGTVAELIVFSRVLNTAERNIMHSYLAAKHANPGGAGTANRYTVTGAYRYHVGGIGQESGGSLATGTSAGLTIANGTFLGTGTYLLAGTDSLNPATGTATSDLPAGYTSRAARTWYATRTGTGTGTVTLSFNLAQLGLTATTGAPLALLYRSGATGAYTASVVGTYGGGGTISFTVSNPQSGYYTLGGSVATPAPAISLSLANATVSDTVNTANFKAIPGTLVKVTATVSNTGTGGPDSNSTTLTLPIPANMKFYLGDIGTSGQGPVQFSQGATASGLSYSYIGLNNTTDGLDFSTNSGTSWTYQPVIDAQQADSAINSVRVKTTGTFNTGTSPNFPSFNVTYGLIIK